ncbi:Flp family type IVb pilin [Novosphingobium acidiphilum]|uniref:Flp family type IVb pilin n=1 Tax=Novosphingobium acidiphilum TaxID=505248 RepID=UPI0003F6953C|nr:Flp family type IVb pilin [Novosphingobium acidiphilum]
MPSLFTRLLRDESAATVVEYGLLIGLLSVVIIVGLQGFSDQIINTWTIVQTYSQNSLNRS